VRHFCEIKKVYPAIHEIPVTLEKEVYRNPLAVNLTMSHYDYQVNSYLIVVIIN